MSTDWTAALVPYDPVSCTVKGKTVLMQGNNDEQAQKCFYESLLELTWLAPAVRSAVMKELGLSLREHKRKIEEARTAVMRRQIEVYEARLRESGERPRGGRHDKAVEAIAQLHDMSVAALKKRLERYPTTERAKKPRRLH